MGKIEGSMVNFILKKCCRRIASLFLDSGIMALITIAY